jgi:peptide-methionine (S)-S-oxide reductase
VGYAGDPRKSEPTYHDLGLHAEAIQFDYDPEQLGFEELLALFGAGHNPFRPPWSPQYRSVIFYHDDEQEQAARRVLQELESQTGRRVFTEVLPGDTFWLAEDYHQKYRLQRTRELKIEYERIYPSFADFVDSTAASRVNGYLDGYGTAEQLQQELPLLGLSPDGQERLRKRVRFRDRSW